MFKSNEINYVSESLSIDNTSSHMPFHAPADMLSTCIRDSISEETGDFRWDEFFKRWYIDQGTPYFFLFRRHLGVTNAQFVELFSLLDMYCTTSIELSDSSPRLLYYTTGQLKSMTDRTVSSALDSALDQEDDGLTAFSELYGEMYSSSVVVDMYFGSCAVFLPAGVSLDINKVVSESGYIHSAGRSVFVRNLDKSRAHHLFRSLDHYLGTLDESEYPIPFVVYSDEDFKDDSDSKDLIANGIESTKIFVEKASMGLNGLAEIIEDMRREFRGRLKIPPPGSYKQMHPLGNQRTLILLMDQSISSGKARPRHRGNRRYYMCYEQTVKNEDPFFFFDENKPAWKSHTTLPHSLTAALLNAVFAELLNTSCKSKSDAVICDPFGGTGTTWFEVRRLAPDATVRCSDASPLAPLLLLDNLRFFRLSRDGLVSLKEEFHYVLKQVADKSMPAWARVNQTRLGFGTLDDAPPPDDHFPYAVDLLRQLQARQPNEDQEFDYTIEFVDHLKSVHFTTRLVFYVALRAALRFHSGYTRRSITFEEAFKRSLEKLVDQINLLITLRSKFDGNSMIRHDQFVSFDSRYSRSVAPCFPFIGRDWTSSDIESQVFVADARELKPMSVDAIVCDPPYGFNTREAQSSLADLYSRFLDSAISALRPKGHLVICLPEVSFTGRDLPYCTAAQLVINQVLFKAQTAGREAHIPIRNTPGKWLDPPYYWTADKALRRTILHFQLD